jgi:hypothetical protein
VGDEILTVNGKSVHELANQNMLYTQSGTFISRLMDGYEFILNRTNRWFPAEKEGARVRLEFKRGEEIFVGHLPWIKRSELARDAARNPDKYKPSEDTRRDTGKYTFGTGSTVRTYFKEGLGKVDLPEGSILNVGALVNAEIRKDAASKTKAKAEDSERPKALPSAALYDALPAQTQAADGAKELKEVERIEAYTIKYKDKTFGVLRIPNYSPGGLDATVNELRWIARVLKTLQTQTDGLIIDQVSNGGGYVFYVKDLLKMFAKDKFSQTMTIDYKLTTTLLNYLSSDDDVDPLDHPGTSNFLPNFAHLRVNDVLKAELRTRYEKGEEWSGPMSMMGEDIFANNAAEGAVGLKDAIYSKPVMVLNDVRSGSGGDFFPALMQKNNRAWIMGTTSSGLGGPVYRGIDNMPGSEMYMRCTMGECHFADGTILENVGAVTDVFRDITAQDVEKGFKGFAEDVLNAFHTDLVLGDTSRDPARFKIIADEVKLKAADVIALPEELKKADQILGSLTDNPSIYIRLKTLLRLKKIPEGLEETVRESLKDLEGKLKLNDTQKRCYEALVLPAFFDGMSTTQN